MSALRIVLLVLLLTTNLANSGCSWRNVATYTAQVPADLRLASASRVVMGQRFLLAPEAHIKIENAYDAEPETVAAAYRGLARVFPASGADEPTAGSILIRVTWPTHSPKVAGASEFIGAGLLGAVTLPVLPRRDELPVLVLDIDGELITPASLDVSPALWGDSWPDEDVVEASFARFAGRLRDG